MQVWFTAFMYLKLASIYLNVSHKQRVTTGNYLAVAAFFFTTFLAACFLTRFLAGFVAGPAALRVVAPVAVWAVKVLGVAANAKPEQNRPTAMHRAVMLDFMVGPSGYGVESAAVVLVCDQLGLTVLLET